MVATGICSSPLAKVVNVLGDTGSIAVGALAGVALSIGFWSILDEHKTSYRKYVDGLKMELQYLQTEYRNMKSKIKNRVTDRMQAKN